MKDRVPARALFGPQLLVPSHLQAGPWGAAHRLILHPRVQPQESDPISGIPGLEQFLEVTPQPESISILVRYTFQKLD